MTRRTTTASLARNLKHLMDLKGWKQTQLADASKVSQRAISNILNEKGDARIDTVEALAAAFGLNGWQLILQDLPGDIARSQSLAKLVLDYSNSTEAAQDYLSSVADREAKAKPLI